MLDDDFGLEVEAGRESEILVGRPGVTVDAAVFAAPVGVQPEAEGDVGAVVLGEDLPRRVPEELRLDAPPLVFFELAGVDFSAEPIEPVGWVLRCSASAPRRIARRPSRVSNY